MNIVSLKCDVFLHHEYTINQTTSKWYGSCEEVLPLAKITILITIGKRFE